MEDVSTPSRFLKECLGMDSADLRLTSGIITRYNSGELNPFEQSFARVGAPPHMPKPTESASTTHAQDRVVTTNSTSQPNSGMNSSTVTQANTFAAHERSSDGRDVSRTREQLIVDAQNPQFPPDPRSPFFTSNGTSSAVPSTAVIVPETIPSSQVGIAGVNGIAESAGRIALNLTDKKSLDSVVTAPSSLQQVPQPTKSINGLSHNLDSYGASQPSTASSADEAVDQEDRRNGKTPRRTRKRNRSTVSAEKDDDNEDPEEKRRRFLERNRIAASKCRQKKKMWIADLEKQAQELSERNAKLTALVAHLSEEVQFLKRQMQAHSNCDCRASLTQKDAASGSSSAKIAR
ncbi:hypothetical protein BJ742DRAFT_791420 [Cladochytrium replicatum]|nr:hypothetical protein BJ742DRAFT_791420 [Cladochytrium replicatum]